MLSLQSPIILPAVMNLSSLWHAAGMLGPNGNPRPHWSEYMQKVCKGQHFGVVVVDMLSVIDLNPSDENCISSPFHYL